MISQDKIQKIKKWGLQETFWRVAMQITLEILWISRLLNPRFYSYFFKRKKYGFSVEKINGYNMYLDLKNDSGISRDLCVFRKREHVTTDFALNSGIIKKDDVVLDIGANIGYYALIWSGLVGNGGKVYALEPVLNNFKMLEKNVELNGIKNIETFKIAAGSENKKDFINVAESGNVSSFINSRAPLKGKEEVDVVKIDDFLKDKKMPKLARMDVEGYAGEILKGMRETLKKVEYLLIELHPHIKSDEQKKEFASVLADSGFKVDEVFIGTNTGMPARGFFPPLIRFFGEKIYNSKSMRQRLENISKENNLGLIFKEGGYSVLFSKK
jgi:FkbM family methyltransferase